MRYRSVQLGLIAISTICIAILLLAMFYYNKVQQNQLAGIMEITKTMHSEMIENVLNIKQEQANAVIHENSAWDELVDYINDPENSEEGWIDENIGSMSESYDAADAVVFSVKGQMLYHNPTEDYKEINFFHDINVSKLFSTSYKIHYFSNIDGTLFEYFGSIVVHGNDINTRKEAPSGYLFMIREVNDELLQDYMTALGNINIGLAINDKDLKKAEQEKSDMQFSKHALLNQYGNPIAYMYFYSENTMQKLLKNFMPMLYLMFGIVLLMFAGVLIYNRIFILSPLMKTAEVVKSEDADELGKMCDNKTEFGVLSRSIKEFLTQKKEIQGLYKDMEQRNAEMECQNEELISQKMEIESQIENIKVLNLQIMERNKETERKNVQISVKNKQLEEQNESIRQLKTRLEDTEHMLKTEHKSLEKANVELTNNQNYAERLLKVVQIALTPTKQFFHDFFVLSKPKSKIGGDFSFARQVEDWVIAGVGDCNMHGTSGAILAVVDLYLMNEIISIRKMSELSPELILSSLNEKIRSTMGEEYVTDVERDGLHLSLFMYNKTTLKGLFAASKRTMVIARQGEITEYFGDNLTLGKFSDGRVFNLIPIQLMQDDTVYMFSDGCTELIGGPYCKRLLTVNFKKEIAKKQRYPLQEQKNQFSKFFDEWIGDLEQTDDISMLVYKI